MCPQLIQTQDSEDKETTTFHDGRARVPVGVKKMPRTQQLLLNSAQTPLHLELGPPSGHRVGAPGVHAAFLLGVGQTASLRPLHDCPRALQSWESWEPSGALPVPAPCDAGASPAHLQRTVLRPAQATACQFPRHIRRACPLPAAGSVTHSLSRFPLGRHSFRGFSS